jgi:hypothetical protein
VGFGVWGLGLGVWGMGLGVWGLDFRVKGSGFGVERYIECGAQDTDVRLRV